MQISPAHGYFDTIFYVDASQSELDLMHFNISVSSGDVQIVQLNYLNRVISIKLIDTIGGSKTVSFNDGSINERVYVKLELPHNPETREGHTIQDSKRPDWPYRTY